MQNTLDKITQMKLIPVVAIQNAGHSDWLADVLIAGGLPFAEITFRNAAALDTIRKMAKRGDMLVGAGTVLTVDQAKAAIDAGAAFLVAPGFNPKSDRGHTAVSQLKKGDIDWETIFGEMGVRWFHTGGIFAALSETTPEVIEEAMICAKKHGTIISYDLNYRPSLWKSIGGKVRVQEVNRNLARYVDVMIGNEEDFTACLGFEVEGVDENLSNLQVEGFKKMINVAVIRFPNFKVTGTTLRTVKTAGINDWGPLAGRTARSTKHRCATIWKSLTAWAAATVLLPG